MVSNFVCLLSLIYVFYLVQVAADSDYYDYWKSTSKEWNDDSGSASDDDYEQAINVCDGTKLCKCNPGPPPELQCSATILPINQLLDTAFISIKQKDFNAEIVKLDHNRISDLREGETLPGQEANVRELDLSSNRIETIERGTFEPFTKLSKLKLSHNRLRGNELSIDWFTKGLGKTLHQLYLDFNHLKKLDVRVFDNLVNLKKLVLDGNKGLEVSKDLFTDKLQNLTILSLDSCQISSLNDDVFMNLTNVLALSLSGNLFNDMSSYSKALEKLHKLTALALSETNLKELKSDAISEFAPKLQKIFMRNMPNLVAIDSCAFCNLPDLKAVDLTNSKITTLSEDIMSEEQWSKLESLKLAGNPFNCECNLKWLFNDNNKFSKIKDKPMCTTPEKLNKMTFDDAKKLVCGGDDAGGSSSHLFLIFLVLFGMCASLFVVGYVFARRRTMLPTSAEPSAFTGPNDGISNYSNLPMGGGILEEEDNEDAEDGYSFDRPEFV